MMNIWKKFTFHPIAFAIFPVLSLLAINVSEVDARGIIRSLLIAIAASIVLFVVLSVFLRSAQKAAIVASLSILFFSSYGHIYQLLKNRQVFGLVFGRHRYLVFILLVILVLCIWFVIKKKRDVRGTNQVMNIISVALLIYPSIQIVSFNVRTQAGLKKLAEMPSTGQELKAPNSRELPDIYYIVLDTYTREDALRNEFNFDNSAFLNELRDMGFYIADCSRSNYSYTQASITATLNMNYISELNEIMDEIGLETSDVWVMLKQSTVRKLLEGIGYKTVAFETGYEWSRIRDADIYLATNREPITIQRLEPFESMLIESTALVLFSHLQIQEQSSRSQEIKEKVMKEDFPYYGYAERQLFILDELPEISELSEPTFTIVHSLIPHVPYVFDPNGEIWSDPGFYSGERAEPINEWYWQMGYTSEIQFINQRMLEIVKEIIENSENPPIILIQGDHGLRGNNRLQVLNAYYLPGDASLDLYSGISPVNSFRVVFDNYFGTDYGLLPDLSFNQDDPDPIPETSQECIFK